ncbi:MAG: MFS transporter [Candidatus Heimdallarchaeota archaeon]
METTPEVETTPLSVGVDSNQPSTIEVLKNAPFMLLLSAQFTQNIGAAVSWLAMQFLFFKLTGSPGIMGLLSIVFWLPYVIFTPFAGVLVDRYDQRKIMLYSNFLSFIASVGFIFVYLFKDQLFLHEFVTVITDSGNTIIQDVVNPIYVIWLMFVLTFINSSAASVFFPARNAYTRLIVKKKNLLKANSIASTIYQVATIVGYVLAGILAGISYLGSFIFDASTFAFSLTMIIFLIVVGRKSPDVERAEEHTFRAQLSGVYDDLIIGYRTIRSAPKITYMLIVFASAIFSFSAFNVLFIIILQGEMGLNETWYGILQSVMGISGIITTLILMSIGVIKKKIALLNYSLIGATLFLVFFAFVRNVWGIGALLLVFGVVIAIINVSAPTLIQEQIPYEKQGRVFGTQQMIQGIARLVGMGIVSVIVEIDVVLPMYILFVAAGILAIIMVWGLIYSNRSGVSGEDYEEISQELITTATSSSAAQITPGSSKVPEN